MKRYLKHPIRIPAGTILDDAPSKTERHGEHVQVDIALTEDLTATLTIAVDYDRADWLEIVHCGKCAQWEPYNEQNGRCAVDGQIYSKDAAGCPADP